MKKAFKVYPEKRRNLRRRAERSLVPEKQPRIVPVGSHPIRPGDERRVHCDATSCPAHVD
jgi:hypothetical protein